MREVPTSVAIILAITTVVSCWLLVTAVLLYRAERLRRVQLPARVITQEWVGNGDMLTVEFPGPDGYARRATVLSATGTGPGGSPTFRGWVWVSRTDPSDVVTQSDLRVFRPVLLGSIGLFVLLAGSVASLVISIGSGGS